MKCTAGNRVFIGIFILALLTAGCSPDQEADICIYGGTSAGVIAAYSAAKQGKTVILVEPGDHLGGLSSGGLGATDIGNKYAVTGLSLDFYRRLGRHYGKLESWTFEPHVAESLFNAYVKEKGITLIKNHRLIKVQKRAARITGIQIIRSQKSWFWTWKRIKALQFIDCSYEGDLLAMAGVSYTIGREDNAVYKETLNGVQLLDKHQFPDSIDPYIIPGDPGSGLVWGINADSLLSNGTGDAKVQAYNYRLCLTQDTSNMIPVTAPRDYDPARYELVKRILEYRSRQGVKHDLNTWLSIIHMPKGKTDINNNGPFSTDYINENWKYPEQNYHRRKRFEKEQADNIKGFLYFLGHDSCVPPELRKQMNSWGYTRDEFIETRGFPHQMYVREARRMIGEYMMTEHNCTGREVVNDPVGLAAYTMDSHNCQRLVVKGMVKNEGDVQVGGFPPYPISYHALTPKRKECVNLLVPVCLSATHIAYGSIRMEPVFMVLSQVCGLAACMAIDQNIPVQDVNPLLIRKILKDNPLLDGSEPEVIIDNADTTHVILTGNWTTSTRWMGQYRHNCMVASGVSPGPRRAAFHTIIKTDGWYRVYYYCPSMPGDLPNWTGSAVFRIRTNTADTMVIRDLHQVMNDWIKLGTFMFGKGQSVVEVVADTITMPVPADAVLLIPER